jgi:hypothetical protein
MEPWKVEMAALARRITELRGTRSQAAFARDCRIDRPTLNHVEQGDQLIGRPMAKKIDEHCGTGGEILRRRGVVIAMRDGTTGTGGDRNDDPLTETGSELVGWQARVELAGRREVSPTDRRQLGAFATATLAASLSERIARADPTPPDLRRIAADVDRIAEAYTTLPAAALVADVERGWLGTERLLDARLSPKVRPRVALYAGQYSFYLAMLAGDLGHDGVADTYLDLAGQHAAESGDLLLTGSVAALESSLAHFRGDHAYAADVAAEARVNAHPYVAAMLAICEARAAALCGRTSAARAALADMWRNVWTGDIRPGEVPVDEHLAGIQAAVILGHLGDGERAEIHARRAIDHLTASGCQRTGVLGGTYNALCRAFLRRAHPNPEQAAQAARDAIRIIEGQPTSWVISTTVQMTREMDAQWPTLPAVRDLGELVASSRKALPAGRSV